MATILEMDPIPDWRLKARSDSTSISPYYSKESVPIRFPGLKKHPITLTERRVTFHAHGTDLPFLAALGPDRTECGCVRLYQALTAPAPLRKAGLPTLLKLLAEQTLLATLDHFFLSHGIQVGVRIGPRQIRVGFVAPGTSGLGWPDLAIYDTQGKRWSTWFMLLCDPRYADVLCQRTYMFIGSEPIKDKGIVNNFRRNVFTAFSLTSGKDRRIVRGSAPNRNLQLRTDIGAIDSRCSPLGKSVHRQARMEEACSARASFR
jgi:hypothetical protein